MMYMKPFELSPGMLREYDKTPNAKALDEAGGYYTRHVSAMTREGLHDKHDIAKELAWRDLEIDRLKALLAAMPTGQWAEGSTPGRLGRHLVQFENGPFSLRTAYWAGRFGFYSKKPILRHARINVEEG